MHRPSIVIITPALADANNGNWQTAQRWARMLSPAYRVALAKHWQGGGEDLMIALHARRSAPAVAAWRAAARPAAHPAAKTAGTQRPVLLVLTGTDLYRDIHSDASAQATLATADGLVVLNALGAAQLPAALRGKCRVVLQSCAARRPLAKTGQHLRALMVGHLRDEKDPLTYMRAAQRLAGRSDLLFDHIGDALDPALGAAATALAAQQPGYRWLGALPHAATRRRIQAAHVLVHASRMEGGANVVIEALRSGTAVIASAMDGNIGLLGPGYSGLFPVGDDAALAALLAQARDDADMLPHLLHQGAQRAPLFTPEAEAASLHRAVAELLAN